MSGSSSLRRRIEALEKALADRERPPFVVVLVGDGETLAEALARHPEGENAQFCAAISTQFDPEATETSGRTWHRLCCIEPIDISN